MSSSSNVKRWRIRVKEAIVSSMGGGCQICGYSKCFRALELHHIDPTKKELSFSFILVNCRSWSAIYKEMEKCVLLCSNCHREVHSNVTFLPSNYAAFDVALADKKRKEMEKDYRQSPSSRVKSKEKEKKFYTPEEIEKRAVRNKLISKMAKDRYREKSKLNISAQRRTNVNSRIYAISRSGVDFSKHGWVKKISDIIGISQQKVTPWMKKHMTVFYNDRCLKRGVENSLSS